MTRGYCSISHVRAPAATPFGVQNTQCEKHRCGGVRRGMNAEVCQGLRHGPEFMAPGCCQCELARRPRGTGHVGCVGCRAGPAWLIPVAREGPLSLRGRPHLRGRVQPHVVRVAVEDLP